LSAFPSPTPEGFELLAGERVSRDHKHAVPFFVRDVNDAQIAARRCLSKSLPGAAGASFVLAGVGQDPFYFGFGHPVAVNMRLPGLGVE
jgi:hypothetical protein